MMFKQTSREREITLSRSRLVIRDPSGGLRTAFFYVAFGEHELLEAFYSPKLGTAKKLAEF